VRNQALVLAKAVEVLRARGAAVSVEEIARRSGLGAGTVIRSFGSKAKLLDAAIAQLLTPLVERLAEAAARDGPGRELRAAMHALAVFQRENHGITGALDAGSMPATSALRRQLVQHAATLIRRAQAEGTVRRDLEVADVALILSGISHVAAQPRASAAQLARYVTVLLDGLESTVARGTVTLRVSDDRALLPGGCARAER
jgi:AcrR family transcriptional regulator